MKKILELGILFAGLSLAAPSFAGVVYEIETTDHAQSPPKVESMEMAVEGRNLKMAIAPRDGSRDGEMIFRGDRRELTVVDGKNQSYQVIDRVALERWKAQMGGRQMDDQLAIARQELEKRLGNMTEEQKRALEQALGQPKGGAGSIFGEAPAKSELRKTGERADHAGYPCIRYDVLRGGEKIREIWVTDWSHVEGGDTLEDPMRELAELFDEMEAIFGRDDDNIYRHFTEVDGFPVVVREFEDGELEEESLLRSARRRTLDPDAFEPPSGYKRRQMPGF